MNIAVVQPAKLANKPALTVHPDHEVVIVGAGISGLGIAIRLKEKGIESFIILERADQVGGTWRDNRYPGIAVDITSFTYSYSFEQNPNWSRIFAPGSELQHYTERVAAKYGIYPHIRFKVSVCRAEFDEQDHYWRIETDSGDVITARHLVSATGGLISPKMPDIKGISDFKGKIIHTGHWDESIELKGKRIAVIGTGATAVQLLPEIAPLAKRLDVYQRTPIWLLKKPDHALPGWLKSTFRLLPAAQRIVRAGTDVVSESLMVVSAIYYRQAPWLVRRCEEAGIRNMKEQLPNRPDLWEKLTPKYGFGCKRPSFSNEYFKIFSRENTDLITAPIDRITEKGIQTSDGVEREIDVLILATGYRVFEKGNLPSYKVLGRKGQEIGTFWEENRYQAYEGLTVPGFPNFYVMLGPYALIGTSYFKMAEGNAIHAVRCIQEAMKRKATCAEIRQTVHDLYFEDIQRRQKNTVFLNHNCSLSNSYYFDKHGDAPMLRPSTSVEMLWRAKYLPMDNYRFSRVENNG
ncbi:MAG: NAD(P)/FAD-dependent oxidoreductase [Pseudomonadota bacterium]